MTMTMTEARIETTDPGYAVVVLPNEYPGGVNVIWCNDADEDTVAAVLSADQRRQLADVLADPVTGERLRDVERELAVLGDISAYNDWIERHLCLDTALAATTSMRRHIRTLREKIVGYTAAPDGGDRP